MIKEFIARLFGTRKTVHVAPAQPVKAASRPRVSAQLREAREKADKLELAHWAASELADKLAMEVERLKAEVFVVVEQVKEEKRKGSAEARGLRAALAEEASETDRLNKLVAQLRSVERTGGQLWTFTAPGVAEAVRAD